VTATTAPTPTLTDAPDLGTEFVRAWRATSRRHPHITYTVTYDRLRNHWECMCRGYFYRGTCFHCDQAIKALVADWRAPRGKAGAA
jgi:hypothetical protein